MWEKKERVGSYGAIICSIKCVSMLHWTLTMPAHIYWEIRTMNARGVMMDFCLTMDWVCISCLRYVCVKREREMNKLVMPYFFFFLSSISSLLYRIHQLSEAYRVSRDGWMDGWMVIVGVRCHYRKRERII